MFAANSRVGVELRERVEGQPFRVGEPAVEEGDSRVDQRDVCVSQSQAGASREERELREGGVEVVAVAVSQGRA